MISREGAKARTDNRRLIVTVRMDGELFDRLHDEASARGVSLNDLCVNKLNLEPTDPVFRLRGNDLAPVLVPTSTLLPAAQPTRIRYEDPQVISVCERCGKSFSHSQNTSRRFCSQDCSANVYLPTEEEIWGPNGNDGLAAKLRAMRTHAPREDDREPVEVTRVCMEASHGI